MKLKVAVLTSILAVSLGLTSCTPPSWVTEAENIAKVALPIVEGIASIVGAGPAVTQVVNDINILINLFDKYQATPSAGALADIQNGLNAVNADLGQIMPAAHIEDSATQGKVAAIVQLVASEFSNITAVVAANNPSPKSAVKSPKSNAAQTPAATLDYKEFKKQYNTIIAGDPRFRKM